MVTVKNAHLHKLKDQYPQMNANERKYSVVVQGSFLFIRVYSRLFADFVFLFRSRRAGVFPAYYLPPTTSLLQL